MAENRPLALMGERYPCDQHGCGYIAEKPQALGIHKRHTHGIMGRSRTPEGIAIPVSKQPKTKAAVLPALGDQVQITLLALDPDTGQVTIGLDGRWRAVLT